MKIPKIEDVELNKVKTLKGGGLEAQWKYSESDEGSEEVFGSKDTKERTRPIHPDLREQLDKMKGMVSRCMDYDKITKKENKEEVLERIEITGVSMGGSGDSKGATITFKKKSISGKVKGMSTEFITFTQNVFGFEEELETVCTAIKQEVYEYLYENKTAEPVLFE